MGETVMRRRRLADMALGGALVAIGVLAGHLLTDARAADDPRKLELDELTVRSLTVVDDMGRTRAKLGVGVVDTPGGETPATMQIIDEAGQTRVGVGDGTIVLTGPNDHTGIILDAALDQRSIVITSPNDRADDATPRIPHLVSIGATADAAALILLGQDAQANMFLTVGEAGPSLSCSDSMTAAERAVDIGLGPSGGVVTTFGSGRRKLVELSSRPQGGTVTAFDRDLGIGRAALGMLETGHGGVTVADATGARQSVMSANDDGGTVEVFDASDRETFRIRLRAALGVGPYGGSVAVFGENGMPRFGGAVLPDGSGAASTRDSTGRMTSRMPPE